MKIGDKVIVTGPNVFGIPAGTPAKIVNGPWDKDSGRYWRILWANDRFADVRETRLHHDRTCMAQRLS